jgi:hypothetical protein
LSGFKRDNASLRGQLLAAENQIKRLESAPRQEKVVEKEVVVETIPEGVLPAMATVEEAVNELRSRLLAPTRAKLLQKAIAETRALDPVPEPTVVTGDISKPQRAILNALVPIQATGLTQVPRPMLAAFSQQSPRSSGYANNLSSLKARGLIEYGPGSTIILTPAGMEQADAVAVPATNRELQEAWFALMSGPQQRIMNVLLQFYPAVVPRRDLADRSGQSFTSSGFSNNLSELKTMGAVEYGPNSTVQASKNLWLSKAQARDLFQAPCTYCGNSPVIHFRAKGLNGHFDHNGIDRLDNNRGYTPSNARTACWRCNEGKNTLSVEAFADWICRVYKHWAAAFVADSHCPDPIPFL